MAGPFASIRVDFLIGRWWTGDFSPNLHWWKVTISIPGRSSRAWTRGMFHELVPVECSNANTPLIPSRYSITKRARLKRRFASRHLRLKRETEASRFQTWNWSKQVSGGSPPTPRLGGLPLHYKTRISDQGPRSMGLGVLRPSHWWTWALECQIHWHQSLLVQQQNLEIKRRQTVTKWQMTSLQDIMWKLVL